MTVRFRIRTTQGQELSFASPEMFEEFVRSGDLAPDDLVYDGETGEWAPARTHPLILEIEYEQEETAADERAAEGGAAPSEVKTLEDFGLSLTESEKGRATDEGPAGVGSPEGAAATADGGDAVADAFGLELAPPPESPSPKAESQAFVERMEAERASDLDYGAGAPSASMLGFKMEDASVLADMARAEPEPEPEPEPTPPVREKPPRPPRIKVARPKPKKGGAGKKVALGLLALGLLGAAGYFGMGLLQPSPGVEPVDTLGLQPDVEPLPAPDPEPEPPAPEPVIASTEEAVRERAQERFLTATQALLADLQPIPDVWVQGDYFLLPSDYTDVRNVWQEYRARIRSVREDDRARYRLAYEQALDDAAVLDEEQRGARLAAAASDFAAKVPDVDAHWDRVEALALAAVQSHDALLGAEGLILYDATGSTGRPDGLGAGTSGRDSDSQLLLDQVIDLLERSLAADGMGPREGANVREWVWGGFLDVITR